jgi:hypothetical protein
MEASPRMGAGSDESHRAESCCGRQDSPSGTPCERGCVRTGSSNADHNQSFSETVETRLATNAAVCGSLGCRESGTLLRVTVEGETRVLCADCVTGFVERKASSSRSQSERDLDLPEPRGSGEGRASGKSDGTRSDRSETSGGCGGGCR